MCERHGAVGSEMRERLACESLGDRANAHAGFAVWRLASIRRLAEPVNGGFSVADRAVV
jgi:hypothetical protein